MIKKWFETGAVALLMAALGIVSTWPLIQYFDTGIPWSLFGNGVVWNKSGDHLQTYYWLWLLKDNFFGAAPFNTNPYEFNMLTPQSLNGLNMIPFSLLYLLFSPLGDVVAYNCLVISSYVLAGVFMYRLVRLYSHSASGAILAAVIFTLAPMRIGGVAGGHLNGFLFFLYPLILYFLEKSIRQKSMLHGLFAGLGVLSLSLMEPHLTYYLFVFLGVYIPIRFLWAREEQEVKTSQGLPDPWLLRLPSWFSLMLIWAGGIALVAFVQWMLARRDQTDILTPIVWWLIAVYPLLILLCSLLFATLYRKVTGILSSGQALAIEAWSMLPLFVLVPFAPYVSRHSELVTETVALVIALLVLMRFLFLARYLRVIVSNLYGTIKSGLGHIVALLPLFGCMGLTVAWMLYVKANKFSSSIAEGGRTLRDVKLFSPHLGDIFVANSSVYIGWVPAVLAGCFCLLLLQRVLVYKRERFADKELFFYTFFAFIAILSYVLALGLSFGKASPYIFFFHYFPYFHFPRVADRIMVMAFFALAIVAGFMVQIIQQRSDRFFWRWGTVLLAFGLAVFQIRDYSVLKPMGITVMDRGQDIYSHVRDNIGDGLLLELPLWPGDSHQSSLYEYYITLDQVRRVNGYSPIVTREYIDTVYRPLGSMDMGLLDDKQYRLLRDLNVTYITVHDNRDIFPPKVSPYPPMTTIRRLKNSPFLEYVDIDNTMYFKDFKKNNPKLVLFKVRDNIATDVNLGMSSTCRYYIPHIYAVGSRLRLQTGEVAMDPVLGHQVYTADPKRHKPGFLVFGPYEEYPAGDYTAYFRIKTGEGEQQAARLEISAFDGGEQQTLAMKELSSGQTGSDYQDVYLDFSLKQLQQLEFRVFYYGDSEVSLDKIVVTCAGRRTYPLSIEAEDLVGNTGDLVFASDCSAGKCIQGTAAKDKGGELIYGPFWKYDPGHYLVLFRIRTVAGKQLPPDQVVAVLSVRGNTGKTVLVDKKITAADLKDGIFSWTGPHLILQRPDELSFQVDFTGAATIQVDRIQVKQIDGAGD